MVLCATVTKIRPRLTQLLAWSQASSDGILEASRKMVAGCSIKLSLMVSDAQKETIRARLVTCLKNFFMIISILLLLVLINIIDYYKADIKSMIQVRLPGLKALGRDILFLLLFLYLMV